jgi:type II secretory pathway predicted ATPase ExeA
MPFFSADGQSSSGGAATIADSGGGTATAPLQVEVLPYHQDYFFDREKEIRHVTAKIEAMLEDRDVGRRTLLFTGERGSGKTWLLLHLHKEIKNKTQINSLYIDFENDIRIIYDKEFILKLKNDLKADFLAFLKKIAEIWQTKTKADATLQEQSYWLEKYIEENTRQRVFVVLLDNVSSAPGEWLELLEEHWLKHLARHKRVLIVMSTRGEMHRWVSPELRLFVETYELGPFCREQIGEYLRRMANYLEARGDTLGLPYRERLEELYQAGGGFALSTYWLARHGLEDAAVNGLIDFLLGFIAEEQERKTIRCYLEALCVLNVWIPPGGPKRDVREADGEGKVDLGEQKRSFREEEMEKVLAAHPGLQDRRWSMSAVREIRDALRRYHLLRWDYELGGYVLDAAVRYPLAWWLEKHQKETWCQLHKAAAQMYREWAGQFARYGEYYDNLAKLHTEQCPEAAAAEEPPAAQTASSSPS